MGRGSVKAAVAKGGRMCWLGRRATLAPSCKPPAAGALGAA
jgi:hypothetical protein